MGWGALDMDDLDRNALQLLEAAHVCVMNATTSDARAVRSNVAALLRELSAKGPGKLSRHADAVLLASSFLNNLAWADPIEPALLVQKRNSFAIAMDRLIHEVGRNAFEAPGEKADEQSQLGLLTRARMALAMARRAKETRIYGWCSIARRLNRSPSVPVDPRLSSPTSRQ
jgi:hypothetical protein